MTIRGCLPSVPGDGDLLHRVLVNVLVNAADSMGEGGCIEITAFTDGDPSSRVGMVHIQIADSGAGIRPRPSRAYLSGASPRRAAEKHTGLVSASVARLSRCMVVRFSSRARSAKVRPFSSRFPSFNPLLNTLCNTSDQRPIPPKPPPSIQHRVAVPSLRTRDISLRR